MSDSSHIARPGGDLPGDGLASAVLLRVPSPWPWLLLALVILRIPAFIYGILDIDETDLVVIGRLLGAGELPYVDFLEKKPLFLYLFYAPVSLFGFRILPMQVLGVLWVYATSLIVERATTRWTGERTAGAAAAWLCGLICSSNVLSVNAEILLNLPAAAALLFYVRARQGGRWRDDLACGLCIGAATLFKNQAGILLFALGGASLWHWIRGRGSQLLPLLGLGLGFAAPWVAVAAIYAGAGHWAEFYEWNVTRNLAYSSGSPGSAWGRFALGLGLYVVFAAPVAWYFAARHSRRTGGDTVRLALIISLWSIWIPVSLGGRFYAHYYLQFAPPLAIIAAAEIAKRWSSFGRGARRAVWLALWIPVGAYFAYGVVRGVLGKYPTQDPKTIVLAKWLRTHTAPSARIAVWGHFTPIYYLAQRLPGTRYYNTSVQMGDFDPGHLPEGFDFGPHRSERDVSLFIEDLAKRRPQYFVDTAPANIHSWGRVPLSQFPKIERYVSRHYRLVASPAGAKVYRIRKTPRLPRSRSHLPKGGARSPTP